jgi:hypothetical protein
MVNCDSKCRDRKWVDNHMSDRDESKKIPAGSQTEDRLALALRENLFRRKAQARARATSGEVVNSVSNSTSLDEIKMSENKSGMKG